MISNKSFCVIVVSLLILGLMPCSFAFAQDSDSRKPLSDLPIPGPDNLSAFDVWITHPASDATFDSGWSSRLQGNQWSALALDKTKIKLNCIESKPGHEQQVSCEQALAACEWPITSRPEHAHGIFWAGENMTLTALTAYIGRHGFELPSQAQ